MKIREWAAENPSISETTVAAGEWLESQGYEFLKNFSTATAETFAAKIMTDRMEKDAWGWEIDGQR
jgi:hypothetical protein